MSWANSLYGGSKSGMTPGTFVTQEDAHHYLDQEVGTAAEQPEDQFAPGAYWEPRDTQFMRAVIACSELSKPEDVLMWLIPGDTTQYKPTLERFHRESVERVGRRVYRGNIATAVERFLVALTLAADVERFAAVSLKIGDKVYDITSMPYRRATETRVDSNAPHAAYLDFDATVRGIVTDEAPHASVVTDFTTKATGRPFVAYITGPFSLEYTGRIDDRVATTASVLRAMIHEAQRKIGRAQCGGSK